MDDVKVENAPYNVIPVTEYDPFEVRKIRIVSYNKIMSTPSLQGELCSFWQTMYY